MKTLSHKNISQAALWTSMVSVIVVVILVIFYTNSTLRSIEKNLPNTLLTEINSLSIVLEDISKVVSSARITSATLNSKSFDQLQLDIAKVHYSIVELRNTYVDDNLINASAFHAIVAPPIADLQIWLNEGVSGYPPNSPIVLNIVEARISEAYQKASLQKHESQIHAQSILNVQLERLNRFHRSVTVLFVTTFVVVCCLIFLLIRQIFLKNREVSTKNEMREQHYLLESLLDNIPIGIAVWDKHKKIIHLNNSFTAITGYLSQDLPELSKWPKLAYPSPQYRKEVQENWRKSVKQEEASEYKVTCRNGDVKDIEFRAVFLPDSRVINTLMDVTDRNRTEKELKNSREIEVRSKKMESMGLLAGGVAHDLNNILSGIVSYPDLILMELPEDNKFRKSIEIIRDSGQKATAITQDLLTIARGVAIAKEPCNINSFVESYIKSPDFMLLQEWNPYVSIDISLEENLMNVMGSPVHIRKIIMNLVSNGCEAIHTSGNVLISTANCYVDTPFSGYNEIKEGEYVVLSVLDQGPGISAEDLDRIFEPFYSKKVMGRSGTGLGLTIVWNVTQDHNGHINVLSSDSGTKFNIYFPITRKSKPFYESSIDISDLKGNGELILIVDDVNSQREITTSIIEKLGYKAESVPSGEAAIDYIINRPVDLILLDMIMTPGINGRRTYEKVLQIRPEQKAIIVSGYADNDEGQKALKLGASFFLMKPITIQELGVAISGVLNNSSTNSKNMKEGLE